MKATYIIEEIEKDVPKRLHPLLFTYKITSNHDQTRIIGMCTCIDITDSKIEIEYEFNDDIQEEEKKQMTVLSFGYLIVNGEILITNCDLGNIQKDNTVVDFEKE